MSYESKVFLIDRNEHESANGIWVYGDEIARFELSCMGHQKYNGVEFRDLFKTPVDFDLYENPDKEEAGENYYKEDMCGAICKYTNDIDGVIAWLEQSEAADHRRRAKLLLNFLRCVKYSSGDFRQLVIVHYGY